jgi:hypothetical protein
MRQKKRKTSEDEKNPKGTIKEKTFFKKGNIGKMCSIRERVRYSQYDWC